MVEMDGYGGYCIARYGGGGGGGGGMYGLSKVDNIMLKFRPIAPKPVAAGSGLGSSTTDEYVKCGRTKRKYVRVNKGRKKKESFKRCAGVKKKASQPAVTLSLLPETPVQKKYEPVKNTGSLLDLVSPVQQQVTTKCYNFNKKITPARPVWLSFDYMDQIRSRRLPQVVSNVTVECVTDTWVDAEGFTDEERVMNMERDTCPGFISDGQDRVVWTNKAYRQMAGVGHVVDGEDITVVLVRKDKILTPSPVTYPAFTCKVRVTSAANSQKQTASPLSPTLTLPCDVWRMKRGAYAWRLDVKAALSLGR